MKWSITSAILLIASLVAITLAVEGFRSGVMYGSGIDFERRKNPEGFNFLGLIYCLMAAIFLTGAVMSSLT
jgi:hypothetical protein